MKIGVKFCGHCAPRRDMMELYFVLRERAPQLAFSYFASDPEVDLLLVLNACEVECASRPAFDGPVIVVSPTMVDHWPVSPEQLPDRILSELEERASSV